jgi:Holliday junction DNA helicase RuvB
MMVRPNTLGDFVGQQNARRILTVLIGAAKKRGENVPHLLLSGPAGLGKTTLARIVAHEMGGRLIEIIASSVKNIADMTHHLMQLKAQDVLFIDEVHALPRRIEETLYPAMEDRAITVCEKGYDDLVKQLGIRGGDKPAKTHQLPPFTLIGATTLLGLTTAPLRSRFRQILQLQPYTDDELEVIISNAAAKYEFPLHAEVAQGIARRSRGTARTAINNLAWYRDFIIADGGVASMEALHAAFEMKGIDDQGLSRSDREYMRHLIEADEPIGLETLASALGESTETVEQSVEPFLLRQGFIQRTPRGRIATEKTRKLPQVETTMEEIQS